MEKHNEAVREELRTEAEEQRALLDLVLETVARDAKVNPQAYLNETIVPEGGE